jgi:hypothetical protein
VRNRPGGQVICIWTILVHNKDGGFPPLESLTIRSQKARAIEPEMAACRLDGRDGRFRSSVRDGGAPPRAIRSSEGPRPSATTLRRLTIHPKEGASAHTERAGHLGPIARGAASRSGQGPREPAQTRPMGRRTAEGTGGAVTNEATVIGTEGVAPIRAFVSQELDPA